MSSVARGEGKGFGGGGRGMMFDLEMRRDTIVRGYGKDGVRLCWIAQGALPG